MFKIDTDSYVRMLRDLLLPEQDRQMIYQEDGSREAKGLIISIDLSMKDYTGGAGDYPGHRGLVHVLVCGYSSAFMAMTDIAQLAEPTPQRTEKIDRELGLDQTWRNVSNHSSCWIDAIRDEINRIYFQWSRHILKRSGSGSAPKDLSQHAWIDGIGAGVWTCRVVLHKDENNGYPGGYAVVSILDQKRVGR